VTTFKITQSCEECEGEGIMERRTSVDTYRAIECEWCDGTGERSHEEEYDTITDAQDDYPSARFTYI